MASEDSMQNTLHEFVAFKKKKGGNASYQKPQVLRKHLATAGQQTILNTTNSPAINSYSTTQKDTNNKMDRQSVFSLSVLPPEYGDNEDTRGQVQSQLEQFILQFRIDNAFIYR